MDTDKYASQAAASADRMANTLHNGIQKTFEGVRTAESHVANAADDAAARVADQAHDTVGRANRRIKEGITGVRDAVHTGREAVSQSSEAILTFTREKPVQALLIAAVSGALVWTLARAVSSRN